MHVLVSRAVKNTAVVLCFVCLEQKQAIYNSTVENGDGVT